MLFYLIFDVIGIFLGGITFFLGVTLLKADLKKGETERKELEEQEQKTEEVRELSNEELDAMANEHMDPLPKLSPLPYLLGVEGVALFLFSAVTFILKLFSKTDMAWWLLPIIIFGFCLLSFIVDGLVMSAYTGGENEENANSNEEEKEEE